MTLSEQALQSRLNHPLKYFVSVDSTNDIAKAWLIDGAPSGAVVIGDEQRIGRGRKGRVWYTPPGVALAISVILQPPHEKLHLINIIGALSVYDLATFVGCGSVGIKWPNDVQVNFKKVSGILPEVVWKGDKLVGVVLGMGINVRNDFTGTELADKAICLEVAVDRTLVRIDLAVYLLDRIQYWYSRIDSELLFDTWRDRLNMLGKEVSVENVCGIAVDVQNDGALLVKNTDGEVFTVMAGDVFVLSDEERK